MRVYLEKGMRRQSIHTVAPKTTREMSVGFKEVFFFFWGGGGGPPAAYGVDFDALGAGGPFGVGVVMKVASAVGEMGCTVL